MKKLALHKISKKGNYEPILLSLDNFLEEITTECRTTGKYSKRIGNFMKCIVGDLCLLEVLEEGIELNDVWNKKEAIHTLLYINWLLIGANTLAQFYINDLSISQSEEIEQLNNYIASKPKIFGDLVVTA